MLDIAIIRKDPDAVKQQLAKVNDDTVSSRIDTVVELDQKRRDLLQEVEKLRAARNALSKSVGRLRGDKKLDDATRAARAVAATDALKSRDYDAATAILQGEADAPAVDNDLNSVFDALTDALRGLSDHADELGGQVNEVEAELNENMLWIPNIPHESVPVGAGEDDNVPHDPEGDIPSFDFEPQPHWDLAPALGLIDFERGVKIAGTRSYVLTGLGARLQRALSTFFLDMARQKGYEEMYVPLMLPEAMMIGSAHLPKFRDTMYIDGDAEVFFLPTAEAALTNYHRDEILDESDLPLYYVGHTPCFRREKMSAGRDTRGIKRVHQFQKVEMYKFTTAESSYDELEKMVEDASDVCRALKIPFRRLEISTGDLGFVASKKWDLEMWAPGSDEWLEVSSVSNVEDFQARRANVRYRAEGEKKPQFVHTLNGSGLALPRVLIAVLENYQQADGSVVVPEVLRPYLDGLEVIEPK